MSTDTVIESVSVTVSVCVGQDTKISMPQYNNHY